MKIKWVVCIIFFSCATYGSFKKNDDSRIKILAQKYVNAFQDRDISKLKKLVSERFIDATGGEDTWRERFKFLQSENSSPKPKVKNLKIVKRKKYHYLHFDAGEKMPDGQWFVVKKDKAKWYIDDLINDFDPEM